MWVYGRASICVSIAIRLAGVASWRPSRVNDRGSEKTGVVEDKQDMVSLSHHHGDTLCLIKWMPIACRR